jgi:hypothetical protein
MYKIHIMFHTYVVRSARGKQDTTARLANFAPIPAVSILSDNGVA